MHEYAIGHVMLGAAIGPTGHAHHIPSSDETY